MKVNLYIKDLLLLNDCVIIPEFGGFIANYRSAIVENNQFSPPSKEIAFNNKLISNDGLLVNYISEVEAIDYFSAKQKLDSFVEDTLLNLERNRNVYFDGIGYLHYDSKENLLFEPQIKENLLAESYGLQKFPYESLVQREVPKSATKHEGYEPVHAIFEKRKMKRLVIAIPLLVALALIPMKYESGHLSKSDMGMWDTLLQTTPNYPACAQEQNIDPITVTAPVVFKYYIIGGSFKSLDNANKFIGQLKEQGYEGQNLGIYNGLNRIAMKGFATMEEAQSELNSLLAANPGSGLWIHVNP